MVRTFEALKLVCLTLCIALAMAFALAGGSGRALTASDFSDAAQATLQSFEIGPGNALVWLAGHGFVIPLGMDPVQPQFFAQP